MSVGLLLGRKTILLGSVGLWREPAPVGACPERGGTGGVWRMMVSLQDDSRTVTASSRIRRGAWSRRHKWGIISYLRLSVLFTYTRAAVNFVSLCAVLHNRPLVLSLVCEESYWFLLNRESKTCRELRTTHALWNFRVYIPAEWTSHSWEPVMCSTEPGPELHHRFVSSPSPAPCRHTGTRGWGRWWRLTAGWWSPGSQSGWVCSRHRAAHWLAVLLLWTREEGCLKLRLSAKWLLRQKVRNPTCYYWWGCDGGLLTGWKGRPHQGRQYGVLWRTKWNKLCCVLT